MNCQFLDSQFRPLTLKRSRMVFQLMVIFIQGVTQHLKPFDAGVDKAP